MTDAPTPQNSGIDPARWSSRISDAEAAEKDWRDKGREIIDIYRAEKAADGTEGRGRFNMLFANTSILVPAVYQQAPQADVRRRFQRSDDMADTASGVLQGALNAAFDLGNIDVEIRRAVQEILLPGRGTIRVRWVPKIEQVPSVDPMTGMPAIGPDGQPVTEPRKVWEELEFEHVFWEDFLVEPTRRWRDAVWVAFRHYLTKSQVIAEFGDDERVAALVKDGEWSKQAFTHSVSDQNRDERQSATAAEPRAMIWECWDRDNRTVDWIMPGGSPTLLRRDEDTLDLKRFFPCPEPMTSISTTNTQNPVPEYEIWRDLAAEVARITERIDAIMKRMRVRGMYNGSVEELAQVLDGKDGEMIAVNAVDMSAAMNTNVWMLPLDMLAQTAIALYGAREQAKQALYEVSGLSDVLRGSSNPGDTATAQRIKGNFGTLRIDDRRRGVASFLRDLTRISAEIMASNFSANTLSIMSGREVSTELEAYLRNEASLMCLVDIETDSTVAADQASEQQAATSLVQAIGGMVQTFGPLVQQGEVPPEAIAELLKLVLKPFKGSRDLMDIITQAMAEAQKKQSEQPPAGAEPPPDPEAQAKMAETQQKLAQGQQDMKMDAEKHALDMAKGQQEMAIDAQKAQVDTANAEVQAKIAIEKAVRENPLPQSPVNGAVLFGMAP